MKNNDKEKEWKQMSVNQGTDGDFLGGPVVKTLSVLLIQGTQVWSLAKGLRFHMVCGASPPNIFLIKKNQKTDEVINNKFIGWNYSSENGL